MVSQYSKNIKNTLILSCLALFLTAFLAGCAEIKLGAQLAKQSRRTAAGGVYKIGQPYQIDGDWYYPQENTTYEGVGIASWYGSKFQGRRTANGEIFDMNLLTAAHPTLPMPVIVRVTNLENGRSVVVRVNDRGPFKRNREIDVSQRAAELLGFRKKGTARVRVRYLQKAPLYDERGHLVSGSEPQSYVLAKPKTPDNIRYVGAAPKPSVQAIALDETQNFQRPKALQDVVYYVQLGVFGDKRNADKLAEKLSPLADSLAGIDIEPVYSGGRNMYRVRLGPLASRRSAHQKIDETLDLGHQDAWIIEDKGE